MRKSLALVFVFLLLSYPLLNLATIGVRSLILLNATNQAARQASHALRWRSSGAKNEPPDALTIVNIVLTDDLSARAGIKMLETKVAIVVKNADGSRSGPFYNPLKSADIDVFRKTYYLQVEVLAQIDPLFTYPAAGQIPGLTSSYMTKLRAENVFEHPQGLAQ
jgi:hypothetical protein